MHRIVVRLPNWIGDAVMATPMLKALREKEKDSHIIACAPPHILELFLGTDYFDETITFHSKKEIVPALRTAHGDSGILLTGSFSSAYYLWRAGIRQRIGFSCHGRRLFLTHPIAMPHKVHDVEKYMALLESSMKPGPLELKVRTEEQAAITERLRQLGIFKEHKLLIVHPGAAYGEAKCWPKNYFKTALQHLSSIPSLRILLVGSSAQQPLTEELAKDTPLTLSLAGKTTIRELMALMSQANCVLSNDSGPMHMAAALKTPLVALFGSTNPERTSPWKWGTVLYAHASCSPCYRRQCTKDFRCMTHITPNMVEEAVCHALGDLHHV